MKRKRKFRMSKKMWVALLISVMYFWARADPAVGQALLLVATFASRLVFALLFMVVQFGGLFYFLARSKTETIRPGDPTEVTFDDYKGQDELVQMVKQWVSLLHDNRQFQEMGGKFINGLLLYGAPGPQPLDAKIASPDYGWITMEEIKPGDYVFTPFNTISKVSNVFDMGEQLVYKVVLDDGSTTRATAEHLWPVITAKMRQTKRPNYKVKKTSELYLGGKRGMRPDAVLPTTALEYPYGDAWLPIPPYTLGAIIGDGYLHNRAGSKMQFTDKDGDIVVGIRNDGIDVTKWYGIHWGISLGNELKDLGLWGKLSPEKFIPQAYKISSIENRQALLAGLLDTDGGVVNGKTFFHSTSFQLITDVIELVRSLGGRASLGSHIDKRADNYCYKVNINLGFCPFRFNKRKKNRWRPQRTWRYIRAIVPDKVEQVRCIKLDDSRGLYLTDNYIPSHNTGKTYLAKALASESGGAFTSIEGSAFQAMFIGISPLKMMRFVSKAKALAREYGSCLAYIDEIDALGASRGNVMGGGMRGGMFGGMAGQGALTRLLVAMDGMEEFSWKEKLVAKWHKLLGLPAPKRDWTLIFVGSTNRPDVLDPALVRPGRFDKKIEVAPPDSVGRREIIQYYLDKIKHDDTVDIEALVQDTAGTTPAAIMSMITKDAVRLALFAGRDKVSQEDIDQAYQEQLFGLERPLAEMKEDQREQVAYHEAGHAVALHYYRPEHRMVRVTIVGRRNSLGYVQHVPKYEEYALPLRLFVHDIIISLAGHVATKVFLREYWTGAGADFAHVRQRLRILEAHGYFGPPTKEALTPEFQDDKLMKKHWQSMEETCERFIMAHQEEVEAVALALLEKKSLPGDDVVKIIEAASTKEPLSESAE